jgi:hypothetical protein
MNRDAEEADLLQAKAVKAYRESGATGPEAVNAAIAEAKKTDEVPEGYVYESPAKKAVSSNIVGAVEDQPGILDDLERAPAATPEKYTPPDVPCITSVWSWSSMWYVDTVGIKNSAGDCVAN